MNKFKVSFVITAAYLLASLPQGPAIASTVTTATTSNTAIVIPGSTNETPFEVTVSVGENELQDVYFIASQNTEFPGIGSDGGFDISFSSSRTQSLGASGVSATFIDSSFADGVSVQYKLSGYTPTFRAGSTIVFSPWNYPEYNTRIKFTFAPGSISFSGSGPWEISLLSWYTGGDERNTAWPPTDAEYLTLSLTEPNENTVPGDLSDTGALANTGMDQVYALYIGSSLMATGILMVSRLKRRRSKNTR